MNDTIIVTLRSRDFEKDFELPCRIPLRELYPRLTAALQKTSLMKFGNYTGVILEKDKAGLLKKEATLLDYGVVTGTLLDVVDEKKYDGFIAGKKE